jgi:hypothetical protein
MHCWCTIFISYAAALINLHGLQIKTFCMLSKFSSDTTWHSAPFLCKTLLVSLHCLYQAHTDGLDSGTLWYIVLKCLWTWVSDFVLINHSTHCAFTETKLILAVEQYSTCYCNSWCWHAVGYMAGAGILLWHCTCDKWCPCGIVVILRTEVQEFLWQMMHK